MYYLAVDYGSYEGWKLVKYPTAEDALDAVKSGKEYTESGKWKILKEVEITVKED